MLEKGFWGKEEKYKKRKNNLPQNNNNNIKIQDETVTPNGDYLENNEENNNSVTEEEGAELEYNPNQVYLLELEDNGLPLLKKGENINKFENHNTINRETVVNNFSLHCPVSKINSEEYLHKARDEINKNERALNNILSNSYPLNTHFIHCRNCMLILAIKSKYYINK